MGDSDDAQWLRRRLSKQFEKLDLKPENYQKIEMLARNCSTSVLESDGKPTNNDLDEKQIDFVASKDRNIFGNETKVDNNKTENDEQAPNNKVEHKVIEIVASTDKNVSQNMINVNNDVGTGINNILKVIPFFLTDVALPTLDVFSDLSLVIGWYWNGHWNFAVSITIPLVLQFLFTVYNWMRLEKKERKCWSWIPLILQCWPQVRALRIIHLDLNNNIKAETKKKELMREVNSTEPFLEAFSCAMIMTVIRTIALNDETFTNYCIENPDYKECPEYNNTVYAPPEYCDQNLNVNRCAVYGGFGGFWWYVTTVVISLLACSLGVTKFLQNGPFSVISHKGQLGGMMTKRFALAFCAVTSSIFTKIFILNLYCRLFIPLDGFEQGNKFKSMLPFVLGLFGLFVLPNLMCSFVSIGLSTGFNKNFIEIVMRYPAAWMLPVCTFFMIGPRKISLHLLANGQRRHLGLSTGLTILNMILTVIMMGIMLILIANENSKHLQELAELRINCKELSIVMLIIIIAISHIFFLFPNMKYCGLKSLGFSDQTSIHIIDVSQNELKPITVNDESSND